MIFREYSSDEDTLKEWARQLSSASNFVFRVYDTPEATLREWSYLLNLQTYSSVPQTIKEWQKRLSLMF